MATLVSLMPDSPLRTAICLLAIGAVTLLIIKPDVMFDERGGFKQFGTGNDETLLPFWMAITLIGLIGYYLSFAMEK